ncbi:MAG: PaaI family thioesterase [Acidobacteriia bacterium]|nr:PaaI family thioesterase [Terriglobia bacterium]
MTVRDLRKASEHLPFNSLLGVHIVRRHPDGVTIECAVRDDLKNVSGYLHGGVAASLADSAMGIGLASHFGGRRPVTTTELKINYLRAVKHGKLIARSHILRVGRHLCVGRVDVFDGDRHLVAVAVVTYILLDPAAAARVAD